MRLDPGLAGLVTASQIPLMVIDRDPNLIWCEVKLFTDYAAMDGLVDRFLTAADSAAVAHLDLDNRDAASLGGIPPGKYWVVTAALTAAGGARLLWSLPLTVDSLDNGAGVLVLHRSNAALVLGSDDTSLE